MEEERGARKSGGGDLAAGDKLNSVVRQRNFMFSFYKRLESCVVPFSFWRN